MMEWPAEHEGHVDDDDLVTKIFNTEIGIIDQIFQHLDDDQLKCAELVSQKWKLMILKGGYWEKRLNKKVLISEEWKEMLSFILAVVNPNLLQEPDGFQTVNFLIKDKLMEKQRNWSSGNWKKSKCSLESPPCLVQSPRHNSDNWNEDMFPPLINQSIGMSSKLIATADGNSRITIRNRFNLDEIIKIIDIPIKQIALTPIPLDAPYRPLIYSVKVSDSVIVACFYYHTEVCVWDAATYNLLMVLDGDLFEADWAPPNPWHFICLHKNSLMTLHGGGNEIRCSFYTISTDPHLNVTLRHRKKLVENKDNLRSVLDVVMDDTTVVIFFACEKTGYLIEVRSVSSFDLISPCLDLTAFSEFKLIRFHYRKGMICLGYGSRNNYITFIDAKSGKVVKTAPYIGCIKDIKMINDKYLVICDEWGNIDIRELKTILTSDDYYYFNDRVLGIDSGLFRDLDGLPHPSIQVVDDLQICLAVQFHTAVYSLYTFDSVTKDNENFQNRVKNLLSVEPFYM